MTSVPHVPLSGRLNTLVIDSLVEADRALLSPRGELVHGCADALAKTLAALPESVGRVELDMSGVVFMDTAGLELLDLLSGYGRYRGIAVSATAWNDQPRRILELAGLDATDPLHGRSPQPPAPVPTASAVALERAEKLRVLQEEIGQLRRAIASRPLIDQARGVLMATHACTSDQAWDILRETSQRSNTKLHTVAAAVTASATAGGPPLPEDLRDALRTAVSRRPAGAAHS
ncbi:ANTAR domain-containing response regulator [Streptomyces sp. NPDC001843]|uniref:ANTAR domain-containing response regulator n=1 Tax=Streptomyces sp. NPDC001843 TaxID=3364617 RepID=UPI0036806897